MADAGRAVSVGRRTRANRRRHAGESAGGSSGKERKRGEKRRGGSAHGNRHGHKGRRDKKAADQAAENTAETLTGTSAETDGLTDGLTDEARNDAVAGAVVGVVEAVTGAAESAGDAVETATELAAQTAAKNRSKRKRRGDEDEGGESVDARSVQFAELDESEPWFHAGDSFMPGDGSVDQSVRELLVASLHFANFEVSTAASGSEAIEVIEKVQPDLIVLDVMLPDIDGFTVTRRIRQEDINAPVLFLTARDDTQDKVMGLTVGGDDYVTKPFSLEEVVARIRAIPRRTREQTSDAPIGGGAPTDAAANAASEAPAQSAQSGKPAANATKATKTTKAEKAAAKAAKAASKAKAKAESAARTAAKPLRSKPSIRPSPNSSSTVSTGSR